MIILLGLATIGLIMAVLFALLIKQTIASRPIRDVEKEPGHDVAGDQLEAA